MIERLLNLLYDFNPSPNAGVYAVEQKPWTREEKLRKFKRDLQVIFRRCPND